MKKLIGIFTILLIATGVFGQKFVRDHSFVERTPTGNNTIEDAINTSNTRITDFDWVNYVHFMVGDRLFLLAYEPVPRRTMSGLTRNIYLYSKDITDVTSLWEQSPDTVFTGRFDDSDNHIDVDFFLSSRSRGSLGTVNVLGNNVEMTIGVERMEKGSLVYNEPITFTFIPISTNFYSVRK